MKITVAISTARSEKESDYDLFQKKVQDKSFKWACDDDLDWVEAKRNIMPEQNSFLECTLDSLLIQTIPPKDIDVIVIDRYAKTRYLSLYDDSLFGSFRHVEDKPSIWKDLLPPDDPLLQTDHPIAYTGVCNARNTAYVMAQTDLIFHIDDNIILTPRCLQQALYWWTNFKCGMKAYRHILRFNQQETYNQIITDTDHTNIDREFGDFWKSPYAFESWDYKWMYGHANTVPLEWALLTNGWDERLDGNVGCEDLDMGLRMSQLPMSKMMKDRYAKVFELGTRHIQWKRPHVRYNCAWMDFFHKKYGIEVRANERVFTQEDVKEFIEYQTKIQELGKFGEIAPGYGHKPHPYTNKVLEQKPFNLRELREKYQAGEFKW